jgi:hypothetical protein
MFFATSVTATSENVLPRWSEAYLARKAGTMGGSGRLTMRVIITSLLLLAPLLANAQVRVELTPYYGFRWGGEISAEDNQLFAIDVEFENSSSYGLMIDFPINQSFMVELMMSRQSTEFIGDGGLFSPSEGLLDVDVSYFHVGALWQWNGEHVLPYVVGSLGLTQLDPDLPGIKDEELSAGFGGGVKLMLNPHIGLRLDARFIWTDTGKDDWEGDCDDSCWSYDEDMFQGEVAVGLHIKL